MKQPLKIIGSAIGIIGAIFWIVMSFKTNELGSNGNNGYTNDLPRMTMKPELQKKIEDRMRDPANRPNFADMNPQNMEDAAKKFQEGFAPEEREEMKKMREQMRTRMERTRAALSPEDQQQLRQKMQQMFRNGGGPWGGGRGRRSGGDGGGSGEGQSR